jgi:hypothetical protein
MKRHTEWVKFDQQQKNKAINESAQTQVISPTQNESKAHTTRELSPSSIQNQTLSSTSSFDLVKELQGVKIDHNRGYDNNYQYQYQSNNNNSSQTTINSNYLVMFNTT